MCVLGNSFKRIVVKIGRRWYDHRISELRWALEAMKPNSYFTERKFLPREGKYSMYTTQRHSEAEGIILFLF